ncbi:MAG: hydrogenase maturation protease [Steroidobacteraceae bacterium]
MNALAPAPVLVLAVGNPSRGDDGLGPAVAARLEAAAVPGVEVIEDFQLQVEHALDLAGRRRVVFVDAGVGTRAPYELGPVRPRGEVLHTSHALAPGAVLETWVRLHGTAPPEAWVLCIRGESFGLGEGLSGRASRHLEVAWPALLALVQNRVADAPEGCPETQPGAPKECNFVNYVNGLK